MNNYESVYDMISHVVQEFGIRSSHFDDKLLPKQKQPKVIQDIIDVCLQHNIHIDDLLVIPDGGMLNVIKS